MTALPYTTMISEANSYFNTVEKSINGNKFTTELLFNIISMATEKYFVGLLMHKNFMPHNHTITDLVNDINKFYSIDPEITNELILIDKFLHICAIDTFIQNVPTKKEMEKLFNALCALKEFTFNNTRKSTVA